MAPSQNSNLHLLASCAMVRDITRLWENDNIESKGKMLTMEITQEHMGLVAASVNKNMTNVEFEFMINKFGTDQTVRVQDFVNALKMMQTAVGRKRPLIFEIPFQTSEETRYYQNMRYKPTHGRGVCVLCGKTVAFTQKGELRQHNCKGKSVGV